MAGAGIHKRRLLGAIATTLVGGLSLASPAQASVPEAESFSQVLRATERVGLASDDHALYRSPVLDAPRRFDLAGLAGVLHGVELRARRDGGAWTAWTETANGDPVWFGGMDQLQVRTHEAMPSGKIGYVRITRKGSASAPAPTTARRGEPDKPDIISRRQWGANGRNGCEPRKDPDIGTVKAAVVHHTVSAVNYSEREARGMVLGICHHHRNTNGWDDIGYNALVDRFGNIYEGRDGGLGKAVIGAHAEGVNWQTTGVAVLGTYSSEPASKQAIGGVAKWLAWKLPQHGIDAKGKATLKSKGGGTALHARGEKFRVKRISGHRDTNSTECPGGALYRQLDTLRDKVQSKINKA